MTVSHFVVRTQKASDLKSICLRNGIQLGELIDYVVSDLPVYQSHKYVGKHRSRVFPPQVINLPVHVGVRNEDAIKICEILVSYFDACSN
jgi:dTDP-4-amino-4,6-dideoxygalactose transaminase